MPFKRFGLAFELIQLFINEEIKFHVAIHVIPKAKVLQQIDEQRKCQTLVSVLFSNVEEYNSAVDRLKIADGALDKALV